MGNNPHLGSTLDSWLREEGILKSATKKAMEIAKMAKSREQAYANLIRALGWSADTHHSATELMTAAAARIAELQADLDKVKAADFLKSVNK